MEKQYSDEENEDFLKEHFESTKYRGRLESPTVSQHLLNRTCGDSVTLDLNIVNNRIEQARVVSQGCVISQSAASILCESIEGELLSDLKNFDVNMMLKFIRIPLSPQRTRCGLLAFEALKQIMSTIE
ncbi:iron-sulfur cluster assembly scaffold protein [Gimesia aquarii]|uniref:NifU-like protein n=1 Tax=Gimesia aquarii TaxID=2527964 RepID=A0A517X1P3_9PLAN|nr:iron-sulfur cluster assembly scaffold protein [Gimesia aquarii]QDU11418.1 NifU-like protein [Gimesia aquarii]